MAVDAGSVEVRLGAAFDAEGFRKYDRALEAAERRKKIEAQLGAKVDNDAFVEYEKHLAGAEAKAKRKQAYKAALGGDFDARAFNQMERALAKARSEKAVKKELELKYDGKPLQRFLHDSRSADSNANHLTATVGRAGKSFFSLSGHMSLLKWPALISGAGMAIGALSALAGGAVALESSLAPLEGLLAAYPALGSTVAQGLGVVKLSMSGVKQVLGGLGDNLDTTSKAWKRLTPEGQKFARELQKMKGPVRELQTTAQRGLLPGLTDGLRSAEKNFPVFNKIVASTAKQLGNLAREGGRMLGSRSWGRDLETQGKRNVRWMGELGHAGFSLADATRHVTLAAGPMVDWIVKMVDRGAKWVDVWARINRENGTLGAFFAGTKDTLRVVGDLLGHVAGGLLQIGKAGAPLGGTILRDLDNSAASFERWTKSARGQNQLADYFKNIKAPLYAAAHLLADVVKMFARLGTDPGGRQGLLQMITALDKKLLPVLEHVIRSTTKAFGPAFITLLTNVLRIFGSLAGTSGPLTGYVKLLGAIAGGLADLLDNNKGLQTMLVTWIGFRSVLKTLSFAGATSGALGLNKVLERMVKSDTGRRLTLSIAKGLESLELSTRNGLNKFGTFLRGRLRAIGTAAGNSAAGQIVGNIVGDSISGVRRGAGRVHNAIRSVFSRIGTAAGNVAASNVVGNIVGDSIRGVRGAAGKVRSAIAAVFRRVGTAAGNTAAVQTVGNIVGDTIGGVRGKFGKMRDALRAVFKRLGAAMGLRAAEVAAGEIAGEGAASGVAERVGGSGKLSGGFKAVGGKFGRVFGAAFIPIAIGMIAAAVQKFSRDLTDPSGKGSKAALGTGPGSVDPSGSKARGFLHKIPVIGKLFGGAEGGVVMPGGKILRGYATGGVTGLDPRDTELIAARPGEGILTPETTSSLGGVRGIAALNRSKGKATLDLAKPMDDERKRLEPVLAKVRAAFGLVPIDARKRSTQTAKGVHDELDKGRKDWAKIITRHHDDTDDSFDDLRKQTVKRSKRMRDDVGDHYTAMRRDTGRSVGRLASTTRDRFDFARDSGTKIARDLRSRVNTHYDRMQGDVRGSMVAVATRTRNSFDDARDSGTKIARDLRSKVNTHYDHMQSDVRGSMVSISRRTTSSMQTAKAGADKGAKGVRTVVARSYESMERAVATGIGYVQTATSNALKGLGDNKPVHLSVPKPKNLARGRPGRAAAGRGSFMVDAPSRQDSALYMLGRDEAVVNVHHQREMDDYLGMFGQSVNKIIRGNSRPNYAAKGKPGDSSGGSGNTHWDRLIAAANKVSARNWPYRRGGGHEQPAHFEPFDCSGAVSYITQQAGYRVPTTVSGGMGSWPFPRGQGTATIFYNGGHTFMRLGNRYWGTSGFARPGGGAGWFNRQPGPGYLAGFRAIHLPNLGADAGSGFGDMPTIRVKGSGPLANIAQRAINRVRSAGSRKLDAAMAAMSPGMGQFGEGLRGGSRAAEIFNYFVGRGYSPEQAAAFVGNFSVETGGTFDPHIRQRGGGPGRGIAQWSVGDRWQNLLRFTKSIGENPYSLQGQLDFVSHELATSERGAGGSIRRARSLNDAVMAVARGYERAGVIGNRIGPARAALRAFSGGKAARGKVGHAAKGKPRFSLSQLGFTPKQKPTAKQKSRRAHELVSLGLLPDVEPPQSVRLHTQLGTAQDRLTIADADLNQTDNNSIAAAGYLDWVNRQRLAYWTKRVQHWAKALKHRLSPYAKTLVTSHYRRALGQLSEVTDQATSSHSDYQQRISDRFPAPDTTGTPGSTGPTALEIADAAAQQLTSFRTEQATLFGSFGNNFVQRGSNPFASQLGLDAGLSFFGASTPTTGGAAFASSMRDPLAMPHVGKVEQHITQVFQNAGQAEAHAFTMASLHEMKAAV